MGLGGTDGGKGGRVDTGRGVGSSSWPSSGEEGTDLFAGRTDSGDTEALRFMVDRKSVV